jgi:hypothetical protein
MELRDYNCVMCNDNFEESIFHLFFIVPSVRVVGTLLILVDNSTRYCEILKCLVSI